jgi:hypothetical protein
MFSRRFTAPNDIIMQTDTPRDVEYKALYGEIRNVTILVRFALICKKWSENDSKLKYPDTEITTLNEVI